jgi:hypothetical protein
MSIDASTVVVVAPSQVSTEIDGETVVLELARGTYFGLSGVGASIWRLLQHPRTVDEISEAIVSEYDVELERCRSDVISLLTELERSGLVETNAPEAP